MLDWTGNPLFALWFAVKDAPRDGTAVFWVLQVCDQHLLPLDNKRDAFELGQTYLFRPPHITQRIVAQDGWFTLHWYLQDKNKFIPLENQPRFKARLKKHAIPESAFAALKSKLELLGISDHVLFPDLTNLCQDLVTRYFPPL